MLVTIAKCPPLKEIKFNFLLCNLGKCNTIYKNIDVTLDESAGPSNNPFDYRFIYWMARNKHLSAIPPTAFYSEPNKHLAEKFIRFCFIKVN